MSRRRSSFACSGLSVARISSSWSARPARAVASGGVCACVPSVWASSAFRTAQRLEALTVATDGGELSRLERFEVTLELAFNEGDLCASRGELLRKPGPLEGRQYSCRRVVRPGLGGSAAWPSPSSTSPRGLCSGRLFVAAA